MTLRLTRLRKLALAALTTAALLAPGAAATADTPSDTLVVATMWEALPLSMKPRRSRFFNESEILDTLVKLDFDMKLIPGLPPPGSASHRPCGALPCATTSPSTTARPLTPRPRSSRSNASSRCCPTPPISSRSSR